MKDIIYKVAQREDYGDLAAWLVQVSQAPEQQCLHTWSGQSTQSLQKQLLSYLDDSELSYVIKIQDGQLVGAMGSEYDVGMERGWLHGPHIMSEDYEIESEELFTRLLAEIPVSISQLNAYLNVENSRGRHFYARQGFKEREHLSYEYWLTPDQRVASSKGGCTLLGKEHETSFKQLYEFLFPKAYYSAERVINMIGESHQVLVTAKGKDIIGFVVVSIEGDKSVGEIQFIGVREDCRDQGHGRRLLLAAIDWLLDIAGVSRVSLNVNEELEHARGLYESVGFKLKFTGIGMEKRLGK
jgi:GNAT superfamily N-acetyltransferase